MNLAFGLETTTDSTTSLQSTEEQTTLITTELETTALIQSTEMQTTNIEPSTTEMAAILESETSSSSSVNFGLIVGLIIGILLFIVCVILIVVFILRRKKPAQSENNVEMNETSIITYSPFPKETSDLNQLPEPVKYKELNAADIDLSTSVLLGEGNFGTVRKAQYRNAPVADIFFFSFFS